MYKGNNPTAKRSLMDLANAMLELMKKNEYAQITITMICQEAKISRQTFYKLFDDKKEVVQCMLEIYYEDFEQGIMGLKRLDLQEFTEYTFRFFFKRKEMIDLLVSQNLQQLFLEQMQNKLARVLELLQNNPFTENKAIYHFYTGGLSSMILYQIEYDQEANISKNAAEFAQMLGNPVLLG